MRRVAGQYPDAQCAAPAPDLSRGPSAYLSECSLTRDGVLYQLRLSTFPGSRGILVQTGSWISAKGKEWVDGFWASLKPVQGREAYGAPQVTTAVTPPVGALPDRALNRMAQ